MKSPRYPRGQPLAWTQIVLMVFRAALRYRFSSLKLASSFWMVSLIAPSGTPFAAGVRGQRVSEEKARQHHHVARYSRAPCIRRSTKDFDNGRN